MQPNKARQIARFHTPFPDEDPDQLYVLLEVKEDAERSRADIRPLNTGFSFPPINTVLLSDLELAEVSTADLLDHTVTIDKADNTRATGRVIAINDHMLVPDLRKRRQGVETNIGLTIVDEDGRIHSGMLFIKRP